MRVAIVGKTNVGKSTLFNRFIEERKALVSPIAGTTRDALFGECLWRGQTFTLIDCAGTDIDETTPKELRDEILKHIDIIVSASDCILFVIDHRQGITSVDRLIAKWIARFKKPTILAINKTDSPSDMSMMYEHTYQQLGFKKFFPISAVSGRGCGDLLDELVALIPHEQKETGSSKSAFKIAIIGKPNVGKSSLINAILNEKRVIVSSIPGTTREPIDIKFVYRDIPLLFIDTAGMRKKTRIKSILDKAGLEKSLQSIMRADLIIFLFSSEERLTKMDIILFTKTIEHQKCIIFAINKNDLLTDAHRKELKKYYSGIMESHSWIPLIFISAIKKTGVLLLLETIRRVNAERMTHVDEAHLDSFLKETIASHRFKDPVWRAARLRHDNGLPPRFTLFVPRKAIKQKLIKDAQLNLIKKTIRKYSAFTATPIIILVKSE